ncbi:hypothetical protein BGX27_009844 [Mortierella sp. AM989]|nr:hypothetical protein BGX27_009844 [Mortierella sp. AM989]
MNLKRIKETKKPSRIYLHMSEIILKGWFQGEPRAAINTEGAESHMVLEDGSLVVRAAMPKDMQRVIDLLGLVV